MQRKEDGPREREGKSLAVLALSIPFLIAFLLPLSLPIYSCYPGYPFCDSLTFRIDRSVLILSRASLFDYFARFVAYGMVE